MIKNLVFDCGNVLCEWNIYHVAEDIAHNEVEKEMLLKILSNEKYYLWDEGKLNDEEIATLFKSLLPKEYEYLVERFIKEFAFNLRVKDDVQDFVLRMKDKGFNIYLLSNFNIHFDDLISRFKALKVVSGYVYSAKNKHLKPNKEIYQELIDTYSLNKEECFFIDDVEKNVLGALNYGFKDGFVFKDNLNELEEKISLILQEKE